MLFLGKFLWENVADCLTNGFPVYIFQQAALVLNASRRFRYTLDLKKDKERKLLLAKIRTHAQVIRVNIGSQFYLENYHSYYFVYLLLMHNTSIRLLFSAKQRYKV